MYEKSFDVIVLGLGAMGSAAVYQLAKRGVKTLGIDQFSPPHARGSSHGDSRIMRQAIGEGEEYVPLALRSYELWREIEKETGRKLLVITGGLIIGRAASRSRHHGSDNFLQNTIATAQKHGIAHTVLDSDQLRKRFPQFRLSGDEIGYYEEKAGVLRSEQCVEAQLSLAQKYGAQINKNERVLEYTPSSTGERVAVKTDRAAYTSGKLIISAGAWIAQILEDYRQYFKVYRQVMYWFGVRSSIAPFLPGIFPVFIWDFGTSTNGGMYGFPAVDGPHGGLKIGAENYHATTTPEEMERAVSEQETRDMYEKYVAPRLPDVSHVCVKAVPCLYTVTPDSKFVIDVHPDHPQTIVASPCSGHGFKHSAAIGEVLAELALHGKSRLDISKFTFKLS